MNFWSRSTAVAVAVLTWVLLLALPAAATSGPPPKKLDCAVMDCPRVLPGATKFEPAPGGAPYLVGKNAAGELVGWIVMSTDVVDIKAYSGKPLVTLLGLRPDGVIAGAHVIHHSEPILLVGIPEKALHDFVAQYVGKKATAKVVVGSSADPDAVTVDVVSGATVTVLAQNQTIMDSVRTLGEAVGVVEPEARVPGHFIVEDRPWTWSEMVEKKVFGRLTVSDADMGVAGSDGKFVDLYFTIADAPQIGRALMGDHEYAWFKKQLEPGQHILVILGNGSTSFKGSAFVRGGIFDRVRVEQGLGSVMFHDKDYFNMSGVSAVGAPSFKEAAAFRVAAGKLDPGAEFSLVFLGSRYTLKGFNRDFKSFKSTFRVPKSVYVLDGPDPETRIWHAAWYNRRFHAAGVGLYLLLIAGVFAMRRWTTANMKKLHRLHTGVLLATFFGLGVWLHAQPSVTQVLTLVGSAATEWRWSLFLSEPILFVFWIFIALVTIVWGRGVFCGWACPYGAMSELLFKLGRKLKLPAYELPEKPHRVLRFLRYGVLLVLVAVFLHSSTLGEKLAEVEPFKSTFFVRPWLRHWPLFVWWLVLVGASLVWWRPFCRYLCPLGAALALPGSFRISGPYRRKFCEKCTICTRGCEPRAIRENGTIDPRECLSCMECEANFRDEEVCPPLIGIERLVRKRAGGELPARDEQKLDELRRDAKRC